jgi:hypothetical protein
MQFRTFKYPTFKTSFSRETEDSSFPWSILNLPAGGNIFKKYFYFSVRFLISGTNRSANRQGVLKPKREIKNEEEFHIEEWFH